MRKSRIEQQQQNIAEELTSDLWNAHTNTTDNNNNYNKRNGVIVFASQTSSPTWLFLTNAFADI